MLFLPWTSLDVLHGGFWPRLSINNCPFCVGDMKICSSCLNDIYHLFFDFQFGFDFKTTRSSS